MAHFLVPLAYVALVLYLSGAFSIQTYGGWA